MLNYPKVYFQMRAMLQLCRKNRSKVKDKEYLNTLIDELENRCILIECEHIDDVYSGDESDYDGLYTELFARVVDNDAELMAEEEKEANQSPDSAA